MSDVHGADSPNSGSMGARSLRDSIALLRRRWLSLAFCLVIAAGLTVAYLLLAPPTYQATAKVRVFPSNTDVSAVDDRIIDEVNLDTEAQLVKSASVAEAAADDIESDATVPALLRNVTVTVPANTTVLEISYAAPTRAQAQEGAQAFAHAYLEDRKNTAEMLVADQRPRIRAQIDEINDTMDDVRSELESGVLTDAQRSGLQNRLNGLQQKLDPLNTQLAVIDAVDVDPGQVINDAVPPGSASSPDPKLAVPSGLMLGLVAGLGLVAWREKRDRVVHDSADLTRLYGIAPVSVLPREWALRDRLAPDNRDVIALQHAVLASETVGGVVVLVVSVGKRELAARVAQALAVLTAVGGDKTALLTKVSDLTAADRQAGPLIDHGGLTIRDFTDTRILDDGEVRPGTVAETLDEMRQVAHVVFVEIPSDDPAIDGPVFARRADAVVVVAEFGRSERERLGDILAAVSLGGVRPVLLVPISRSRSRGHGRRWRGWRRAKSV